MAAVAAALVELDSDTQKRVIKWAADRYGVPSTTSVSPPVVPVSPGESVAKKISPTSRRAAKSAEEPDAIDVDEAAVRAAIAEYTGVAEEKLERLFHIDNGVVKVIVNHSKLGSNEADKARTTAQIVTVVGKLGLGHDETPLNVIRDECARKHFYSVKHFTNKHMPNIDGFVIKGEGRASKRLQARPSGINAFPALVDRVLGES